MAKAFGLWVDMHNVKLDDAAEGTWIQALPLGTYEHPEYGTIDVTADRIKQFALNVTNKVRGQDLDIDYDHKADSKIAAGWVRGAEARPDGLYLRIEWTDKAKQHLKDKEYRYFSPEFQDEWTHPKDKQVYKDVLFGGALTNRPFLKDILPINLSEMLGDKMTGPKPPDGGGSGSGGSGDGAPPAAKTPEEVLKDLQKMYSFEGTPEEFAGYLKAKQETEPGGEPVDPALGVTAPPTGIAADDKKGGVKLSEEDKKNPTIVALAEGIEKLMGISTSQAATITALAERNHGHEVDAQLQQLTEGNVHLTPAARDNVKKILAEKDGTKSQAALMELLGQVVKGSATVELGERGSANGGPGSGDKNAIKEFTEFVTKLQTERKLSYADAVAAASAENTQLAQDYQTATMSGMTL